MNSSAKRHSEYDYLFKMILTGDAGVGKSSIMNRFSDDSFGESYCTTIGVDFRLKTMQIDGRNIKLQMWDTAGQERFRTITQSYYRGAHGIFITFDVTDRESFEHLDHWRESAENYSSEGTIISYIGNKADLNNSRKVTAEEAKTYAETHGSEYYEVSSKTGMNIDKAFIGLATKYVKRMATSADESLASASSMARGEAAEDEGGEEAEIEPAYFTQQQLKGLQVTPPPLPAISGEDLASVAGHMLPPTQLTSLVEGWLREDCPGFDVAGALVGTDMRTATIYLKSEGVMCGRPFVDQIFKQLGCDVEWLRQEGSKVTSIPIAVGKVKGPTNKVLLGERPALNVLARASGVASTARRLYDMAKEAKWKGRVACTRKTTPGFRMVEKYAAVVGGIDTHRYDLSSMVMLKHNHFGSAHSSDYGMPVVAARRLAGFSVQVEVECGSCEQAEQAAKAGANIVMLDNMTAQEVEAAGQKLKAQCPAVLVEASGGITDKNISQYFLPHIDVVSSSQPIQGYPALDFSMKIDGASSSKGVAHCLV